MYRMSGVEKIKDLPEKVSSPENAEGIGHHGLSQRTFQAFRFTLKKLKKLTSVLTIACMI
jgi:hypothetical protein